MGGAWPAQAEALLARREIGAARAAFGRAMEAGADPDRCNGGLWMCAMLEGDFAAAWRESDAIRARGTPDPHRFWQSEEWRDRRVIIRCLHGFGDTVQMLRYAPLLRRMAANVVWEVPPRMLELAPYFRGVEQAITWTDEAPAWNVQVEVMELPYLMRTALEELPIATEYLALPPVMVDAAGNAMGVRQRRRVGLVWAGGDWNAARSVPFSLLERLLNVEGIEFWSLQGGAPATEAQGLPMRDAAAICGSGQVPLAATIANLDLVITVDTLAAHLAGALGCPVWVMLPFAADWRWMVERDDSPWYASMRLFRQQREGDWAGLVDRVEAALREFEALPAC